MTFSIVLVCLGCREQIATDGDAREQQTYISHSCGGWEMSAWSRHCCLFAGCSQGSKGRGVLGGLFPSCTDPISEGSALMTESPLTAPSPWGSGFQYVILGGGGYRHSDRARHTQKTADQPLSLPGMRTCLGVGLLWLKSRQHWTYHDCRKVTQEFSFSL